ncbi:helix loop helix domain [Rhizoctonia solani]|uniref:Helix loop helix domain n=1 Tax=Rhizoctonia solani TaxID=456999 RepID=A0A8H7H6N6_9AGAM|nr:helix loop helix domain [Rhizoctonia solani]
MLALPPRRRSAYDPSMYFSHNNFGSPFDAFNRVKYDGHASVDFSDTLASMISESDARNATNGGAHPTFHGQPQPNPFDPHQFPHASSGHPILSPTGPFPPAHHAFPASAPATSVATSIPSFFDGSDYAFLRGGTDRADTPSLASPTTADSPYSQTAPPLTNINTAPSKRGSGSAASRSRSRGPAAASTSRSRGAGARKRASISSPSPPPVATIPSQNAWYIPTHGSQHDGAAFGFGSSLAMSGAGASPKSIGAKVSMAEDLAAKQAQILSEKRRRRRESHNAVERRRRDNINEKISELSTLIPECLLSENPTPTSKDDILGAVDEEGTREGPKANKGMILRKSVDYIKYLQQLVRAQANRNRELESQLSHYRGTTADGAPASDESPLPLLRTGDSSTPVDLGNLFSIEDEDSMMSPASTLNPELSNQIMATLENRLESAAGETLSADEDEESLLDEDERGRQCARRGRFGRGVSLSVGKSERVDEVDESALSDGSGKMED